MGSVKMVATREHVSASRTPNAEGKNESACLYFGTTNKMAQVATKESWNPTSSSNNRGLNSNITASVRRTTFNMSARRLTQPCTTMSKAIIVARTTEAVAPATNTYAKRKIDVTMSPRFLPSGLERSMLNNTTEKRETLNPDAARICEVTVRENVSLVSFESEELPPNNNPLTNPACGSGRIIWSCLMLHSFTKSIFAMTVSDE